MASQKFTIYLGLDDKDARRQIVETSDAAAAVSRLVVDRFGYGTVIAGARGVYSYTGGGIASENTIIVILYLTPADRAAVVGLCNELKKTFNQESVGLESVPVSFECV